MKVILYYDISTEEASGQKRLGRVLKICRKYLHHVQKSVFEGELSEGQVAKLKAELKRNLNLSKDSLIIYIIPESLRVKREILTETPDATDNVL